MEVILVLKIRSKTTVLTSFWFYDNMLLKNRLSKDYVISPSFFGRVLLKTMAY